MGRNHFSFALFPSPTAIERQKVMKAKVSRKQQCTESKGQDPRKGLDSDPDTPVQDSVKVGTEMPFSTHLPFFPAMCLSCDVDASSFRHLHTTVNGGKKGTAVRRFETKERSSVIFEQTEYGGAYTKSPNQQE